MPPLVVSVSGSNRIRLTDGIGQSLPGTRLLAESYAKQVLTSELEEQKL